MTILILILGLAAIAFVAGLGRPAGLTMSAIAILLAIVTLLPLGKWLAQPLENDFPSSTDLSRVDGIVVMGGSVERVLVGAQLALTHPSARLVLTGETFARPESSLMQSLGIPRSRIVVENRSENTFEDIAFSDRMVEPKPLETWLLVSSAVHIPRAMAVARHVGWRMDPIPVHFISRSQERFGFLDDAEAISEAAHEYLGLLAYRLEGRIDEVFPRPEKTGKV